jgi:predicted amidohydrolase
MTSQWNKLPEVHHVGFVQLEVEQGKIERNLERLRQILTRLEPPRQALIVLPELWATGFAYLQLPKLQDEVAALSGALRELAERLDIILAGSLPERLAEDNNPFFNTLEIIGRGGTYGKYRKRHIFPGEEEAFRPCLDDSPPIVTPAGRFGCLICYDLRFPGPARKQCQQGADLLLCSAEWPAARIHHWRALTIARAIENQTFMVACNGVCRNGEITLGGHSLIVSPAGEVLYEAGDSEEAKVVAIDWREKKDARAGFRSFTAEPYPLSAGKIGTPENCLEEAELRAGLGQRVVYAPLDSDVGFSHAIEVLEAARRQGDYLVAGVRLPGDQGRQSQSEKRKLLKTYAALGCVDAVFELDDAVSAIEERLKGNSRILKIDS